MSADSRLSIAVVGAGAFGSMLAARIFEVSGNVTLIAHRVSEAAAIAREGLTLIDARGERVFPVPCVSSDSDGTAFDVLVFCVKAYDTRAAAIEHRRRLAPGGMALTLQNGAGNIETLVEVFGRANVLAGVSTEAALLEKVGRVRNTGSGQTEIGELDGATTQRLSSLMNLLNGAGYRTARADSVARLIWRKLTINIGINALTAISRKPNGWIADNPHARDLAIAAVHEACDVAVAAGCPLDAVEMADGMLDVSRNTAANRSSMLTDVERGRQTEIESIQGYVVRMGERFGVKTPINDTLRHLVDAMTATEPRGS